MKDVVIVVILSFCALMALKNPLYGLYGWFLVSFMNIHRLGWGLAISLQPGLAMAATTGIGIFLHPKNQFKWTRESQLVFLFWAFTLVTTIFSINQNLAWPKWVEFSKSVLFFFITIYLIDNFKDLRRIIILTTFCIAFYGLKGGLFSLVTGGQYRVFGPPNSFIADNNELALALNMTLPLIYWITIEASSSRKRLLWICLFILTTIGIIFTFSRGGFLTLILVGLLILRISNKRVLMFGLIALVFLIGSYYIGENWIARMETIPNFEQENSALDRLVAWKVALRFALDHILLGGGFNVMGPEVYALYGVESKIVSHSIYFGTLVEHGFIGLGIYLLIFASTITNMRRLKKTIIDKKIIDLLSAIIISLIAFLFGGLFYERQYFDYAFYFISLSAVIKLIVNQDRMSLSVRSI